MVFDQLFEKAPPAGFEPAHTAPETMRGSLCAPILTCANISPADTELEFLSRFSRVPGACRAQNAIPAGQRRYTGSGREGLAVDLVQQGPTASRCVGASLRASGRSRHALLGNPGTCCESLGSRRLGCRASLRDAGECLCICLAGQSSRTAPQRCERRSRRRIPLEIRLGPAS